MRQALLSVRPDLHVVMKPMADGGEGTEEVLVSTLGGKWVTTTVMGPLPEMRCAARYGFLSARETAIIAMANASGLALLRPEQRNPLLTTTYGVGELIQSAIERGVKRIWLAVGGSA